MDYINESLKKIIEILNANNSKVVGRLNIGLKREEIVSEIKDLDINFQEDFYKLYSSINGTEISTGDLLDDCEFFPGFYFLNLSDAVKNYKTLVKDKRWNKDWFPIFANGGGDFFCLICDNENKDMSPILGFMLGDESMVEYISIESMMKTICECYVEGAYYITTDHYFEVDDELEKNIASKYNPGLDRWK